MAMGALPFLGTVAGLFIPGGFLIDAAIAKNPVFVAGKADFPLSQPKETGLNGITVSAF
jgi:hypothetical protein